MRRLLFSTIAVTLVFLLTTASPTSSTTSCDQTFTLYGKTAGKHAMLIWDLFIGGECERWTTHVLVVGSDKPRLLKYSEDAPNWVPDLLSELPTEAFVVVPDSAGVYHFTHAAAVAAPPPDTTFPRKWDKIGGSDYADATKWYRECPVNCLDNPAFLGVEAELVYWYEGGLYKNYGIKEVAYFPESGYVFIKTNQPLVLTGMDRMDGLLIYRLIFPEGE